MGFEVDFSQASGGGNYLPTGEYSGIVTAITKNIEKSGKASIQFSAFIDGKTYQSRKYFLGGKDNNFYLKQAFNLMGCDITASKGVDIDSIFEKELKGAKVLFVSKEREGNGKTYHDLEPVKRIGKATEEEMFTVSAAGAPF